MKIQILYLDAQAGWITDTYEVDSTSEEAKPAQQPELTQKSA